MNEIVLINEITKGDCIFVGSVCSYLNGKIEYEEINDIDFIITTRKSLEGFENLIKLKENKIYDDVDRYYVKKDGYSYDMFLTDKPVHFITSECLGKEIKHLSIDGQIVGLTELIERIDSPKLLEIYKNKIEILCV